MKTADVSKRNVLVQRNLKQILVRQINIMLNLCGCPINIKYVSEMCIFIFMHVYMFKSSHFSSIYLLLILLFESLIELGNI